MLSGGWRIRKNDKLETLFQNPNSAETIRNKGCGFNGLSMLNIVKSTHTHSTRRKSYWEKPVRKIVKRWEDLIKKGLD